MRSNNPIFNRSPEFNGQAGGQYANSYGTQTYPGGAQQGYGAPYGQSPYGQTQGDPSQWQTGVPAGPGQSGAVMTVDSVVQKTAISLFVVVVAAAATWFWTGEITSQEAAGQLYLALMVGSLGAFALSMVNSFKRVISPPLVLAFAALEGVFLGAFSKYIDQIIVQNTGSAMTGVIPQAVLGTMAAFAGTLAAYKVLDIKVGAKFRTFVMAAMFGMVALGLLEFALSFFGGGFGIFGFGGIGFVFAVLGLVLGVFMLILDFDFIEHGVSAGIPERESWRAAFAMTVSLVWIYTNLLRILAIFQQD
jgi:uncharacterized YccA/Bax inhibitor family protein